MTHCDTGIHTFTFYTALFICLRYQVQKAPASAVFFFPVTLSLYSKFDISLD